MNNQNVNVLIVEDNPDDVVLLREGLAEEKEATFNITEVDRTSKAIQCLQETIVDVVLLDLSLPDSSGLDTLKQVHAHYPEIPIVVSTGLRNKATAMQAVREGAQDYLVKGEFQGRELTHTLWYAIERKRLENQLYHDAYYDALTALPNRACFMKRLSFATRRAQEDKSYNFAVFFLDVDGFKQINDRHGHAAGDHLLRTIAQRLKSGVRPSDMAARLGGDEFTVLLEDVGDETMVRGLAERLLDKIQIALDLDGKIVPISVSLGVTLSTRGYNDLYDALRDADEAMYESKRSGGHGLAISRG